MMQKIVVIGGGVIGLATARELLKAGLTVTVLERGRTGREASWASGGILSPLTPWQESDAVTGLSLYAQSAYPQFVRELKDESDIDPERTEGGFLFLDLAERESAIEWADRWKFEYMVCDRDALVSQEPNVQLQGETGLFFPAVAHVRPPRLLNALHQSVLTYSGRIREGTEVKTILVERNRVVGVDTDQGVILADGVVVAAGAWSGTLMKPLGIELGIKPVKGQMILFQAEPGLLHSIVIREGRYVIPRRDGCILAGSTEEYVGFDKQLTEAGVAELKEAAVGMVPALAEFPISHQWAGLRPGAACDPWIGPHPDIQGLYFNTGHAKRGILLAPVSARLLADTILDRQPVLNYQRVPSVI